jgi:hypothetical protein
LRTLIAIAAGTLALSATTPAAADYASRDYDRGCHDCLAGQYDQEEHGHAYGKDATPRNANAGATRPTRSGRVISAELWRKLGDGVRKAA